MDEMRKLVCSTETGILRPASPTIVIFLPGPEQSPVNAGI